MKPIKKKEIDRKKLRDIMEELVDRDIKLFASGWMKYKRKLYELSINVKEEDLEK